MSEITTGILEESPGKIVLMQLKDGKKFRAKLNGFDQHLNFALEETEDTTNAESF